MRIYTKSGDKGETGLIGGRRVSKSSLCIAAIGEVDELNAALGILRTLKLSLQTKKILKKIQNDLFNCGAELAAGGESGRSSRLDRTPHITTRDIKTLENHIDLLEKKLPRLTNFILPGGTPFAAQAHLARAICRRAERTVVALQQKEPLDTELLMYLNRLSDLLFMLSREDMAQKKVKEMPWKVNK